MSTGRRVLLTVLGIVLLAPGLCSLFAINEFGIGGFNSDDLPIYALWLFTFAIAFGGFILLRKAYFG